MSLSHILILAVIILIAVPPEKLPEILRNLGRLYNDFRRQTQGLGKDLWPDQDITDIKKHVQRVLLSDDQKPQNSNLPPQQPPISNQSFNQNQNPNQSAQTGSSDKKEPQG